MKKIIIVFIASILYAFTVNAQLKVSTAGNMSVGLYQDAASALSVNGTGDSTYKAYIDGKCKVTNIISGTAYQPTTFPDYDSTGIHPALSYLLQLAPVMHYYNMPPFPFMATDDGDESAGEGQQDRQGLIPGNRFSITPRSLVDYFSEQVCNDENNKSLVNYDELIPVLVYAVEDLYHIVSSTHNIVVSPQGEVIVQAAELFQHTFDPLTARTDIRFRLPEDTHDAYVCISDLMGKRIREIPVIAGQEMVSLQGGEYPSGMYLYSLVINGQEIDTKRMILSK